MEKKKRLINFLAGMTKILLIATVAISTLVFVAVSIQLATNQTSRVEKKHATIDLLHEYDASLEMDTKIFYRNGETLDTTIKTSSISAPVILADSAVMTIIYLLLLLLLLGNFIFLMYQFYRIFSGLKYSLKQGTFFYRNIHMHIKRVAFSLFVFSGLMILNKAFFIYSIKKIEMMDQTIHTSISIGSDTFLNVFFGLVILLIGELFKEGLKLKQESELTI